jgi:hypothetical protein
VNQEGYLLIDKNSGKRILVVGCVDSYVDYDSLHWFKAKATGTQYTTISNTLATVRKYQFISYIDVGDVIDSDICKSTGHQ